jgi:sugar lactone lactonase YvrE
LPYFESEKRSGATRRALSCVLLLATGLGAAHAQETRLTFTQLAGGYTGDAGQRQGANLHGVDDVVFDKAGNLYISQYEENRIRKVTPAGVVSTLVGGNTGFAGDGGAVASALINRPSAMAFDSKGNLFFADTGNHRVRRIDTHGVITTVVGNGALGPDSGNNIPAKNTALGLTLGLAIDEQDNLYISDLSGHRVYSVTPSGVFKQFAGNGTSGSAGDGGPATSAQLYEPNGIDLDAAGNLYIADAGNRRVRKVTTDGKIATVLSVSNGLVYPFDLGVDPAGNLWVPDYDCTMTKLQPNGIVQRFFSEAQKCGHSPDGTPLASALIGAGDGVAFDANGDLYFADVDNGRVAKIDLHDANLPVSTFAGRGAAWADGTAATSMAMSRINAIAVDGAFNVGISDWLYARLVRKLKAGRVSTILGTGSATLHDNGNENPPLETDLSLVTGIAAGPDGSFYVAERGRGLVFRVKPDGTMTVVAGGGSLQFAENAVATSVEIDVRNVAVDTQGNVYIADYEANRIYRVDTAGRIRTFAGNGATTRPTENVQATASSVPHPMYITLDEAGNVFYFDASQTIRKITLDGTVQTVAGFSSYESGTPPSGARLGDVISIAAGPYGLWFIANGQVRRITPTSKMYNQIETITGLPFIPTALAMKRNHLFVATENGRLMRATLPRRTANDFNADGKSDLAWRNIDGRNTIWLGADPTTQQAVETLSTEWKFVAQGDLNGDAQNDIVWRNTDTGFTTYWRSGVLGSPIPVSPEPGWVVAGVGDFDGDGSDDVFARNLDAGWAVIHYSGFYKEYLPSLPLQWQFAGVGDFDADGRDDVLWRNGVTGQNAIWLSGHPGGGKPIYSVPNTNWKVAAVADFTGDGVADILWRDMVAGTNTIWRSANAFDQQATNSVPNLQWTIATTGDYDGDGIYDIVWRNTASGANTIWKNGNGSTQKALMTVATTWSLVPYEGQP